MEPEEMKSCYSKKDNNKCSCIGTILCILLALLLATIGLILGAIFANVLLANIAILILGTAILGLLVILTLIYKICTCAKSKNKCC